MKSEILNKIIKEIENISKVPKSIIKYGCLIALAIFLGAIIVFVINNNYFGDYLLMHNCMDLIKTSTTIFAEIVIGSLIIDYFIKTYKA